MNVENRLETAHDWLDEGRPLRALQSLPRRPSVPMLLRAERDFIEAESKRLQGYFAKALELYGRLLSSLNAKMDPALWIEASLSQAACYRSLGNVAQARESLRRAGRLAKSSRLLMFRSQIELERALVDRAAGYYGRSLRQLSHILKNKLTGRFWNEAAFILWAMGGALRFQGDLRASKAAFDRSLALAGRARDSAGRAYALFGLGGVTRVMGRLQASAQYYAAAAKALNRSEDIFGKAYAQCGYANALRQSGRLKEAEAHYRAAHALYSQLEDEVDLAYVEWGLGKIYLQRGKLAEAQGYLKTAFRLFSKHHETRGEVLSEVALAQALHASGKTWEAERLFASGSARARRHRIHAHLEVFT